MKLWREYVVKIYKPFLLCILTIAIILQPPLAFFEGIYSSLNFEEYGFYVWLLVWLVSLLCLVTSTFCLAKHRPVLKFSLVWILLMILQMIVLPPGIFWIRAGAIYSARQIGLGEIVQEGQALIRTHKDGDEIMNYPPAISRLHPIYVVVDGKSLMIKKEGMGDWAGFIITLDPTDHRALTGQKTKICDYLYWYND